MCVITLFYKVRFSVYLLTVFFLWARKKGRKGTPATDIARQRKNTKQGLVHIKYVFTLFFKYTPFFLLFFVFVFKIAASSQIFLIVYMVPMGFLFDPARFVLLCILYTGYFKLAEWGYFKKPAFSFSTHVVMFWVIAFLNGSHMYFMGDPMQCPGDDASLRKEMVPVLTMQICDRNESSEEKQRHCRNDVATTHALFVDPETNEIFIPHMGSKNQFPLCAFNPLNPTMHKVINVRGSAHHLAADISRREVFLPLMSDNTCLIVSMDSLKVVKVLKPTTKSSLIDAVFDDKRRELFVLSEDSNVVQMRLNTGKIKRCDLKRFGAGSLYALGLNKKTHRLYVSSWIGGQVFQIDVRTMKVMRSRRVGVSTMGLFVDEQKNIVFVALPFTGTIAVIDGDTLEVIRKYKAGFGVRDITYIKNFKLLMAGNYFSRSVDFISLSRGKIRSFYTGPMVRGVYYDPRTHHAYAMGRCGIFKFDVSSFAGH